MIKPIVLAAMLCMLCCRQALPQSIGLNNDNSPPHASAMLDVKSTAKGFLLPRMTLAQRNAIKSPARGLTIYQTDNNPGFYYYFSEWLQLSDQWQSVGNNLYSRNTGNMGIGTKAPLYKLSVKTASQQYGFTHADDQVTVGSWIGEFQNSGYGGWLGTVSNHPLHFFTGAGPARLTISTQGNIGVGALWPLYKMEVAGRMRLWSESLSKGAGIWLTNPANTEEIAFVGVPRDSAVGFFGNRVGWGMVMNTASGNVGIGTTSPLAKLHVRKDGEGIRLNGDQPFISFYNSANAYRGYLWNRNLDDIELGTSAVNTYGNLYLSVKGTPAITIESNGKVAVAGEVANFSSDFTVNAGGTEYGAMFTLRTKNKLWEWSQSPGDVLLGFYQNGELKAGLWHDGDWVSWSDRNVKENIRSYKTVMDAVRKLSVYTYRYKSNSTAQVTLGLIAQDVMQQFPEIVHQTPGNNGKEMMAIAYAKTGVIALKAIQEQQAMIDELKDTIARLKQEIDLLKLEAAK